MQLVKTLLPDEGGFHLDKHNQPYAKVIAGPRDAAWTIDASHETIEMLVDPWGNRVQSSRAIEVVGRDKVRDATGQFNYLVEACDPCERISADIRSMESSYRTSSRPITMIRCPQPQCGIALPARSPSRIRYWRLATSAFPIPQAAAGTRSLSSTARSFLKSSPQTISGSCQSARLRMMPQESSARSTRRRGSQAAEHG